MKTRQGPLNQNKYVESQHYADLNFQLDRENLRKMRIHIFTVFPIGKIVFKILESYP